MFDDADLNYYQDDKVTYLSRSDWETTWPVSYEGIEATDDMIQALENNYTAVKAETDEPITYGEDNGLSLAALKDAEFDDPRWEDLLDQMTLDEQITLVTNGLEQTAPVMSIGFTGTNDKDGPGGLTGRNFEYYSEDAFLGGAIGASDVSGGLSKGLRSFFKHFAMNDQESERHGVSTFANEQAIREIYLKQF